MSQHKNLKFRIKDASQSIALQQVLFKLGYWWHKAGDEKPQFTYKPYLYTYDTGMLFHSSNSIDYFLQHNNEEMNTEAFIAEHTPKEKEMTEKFKVGDRVVCVDDEAGIGLVKGQVYLIVGECLDIDDEWYVEVNGCAVSFQGRRFRFAEEGDHKASSSVTALVSVLGKLYAKEDVEKAIAGLQTYCVED